MRNLTPRSLFRTLAVAEAITWTLLLIGMFLKYVTETTELGVRIFGMVHGVVFIAYCLVTVIVAIDQRWSVSRGCWAWWRRCRRSPPSRSRSTPIAAACSAPTGCLARTVRRRCNERSAGSLRHYLLALGLLVVAVGVLTAVALAVGPPVG